MTDLNPVDLDDPTIADLGAWVGSDLIPRLRAGQVRMGRGTAAELLAYVADGVALGTAIDIGSVLGTLTIDLSLAEGFEIAVTENITTVNIINEPPAGTLWLARTRFVIGSPGGFSIAWPGALTYSGGGSKPNLSQKAGKIDRFDIIGGWPSGGMDLTNSGLYRS
jgi:hypothetical protein